MTDYSKIATPVFGTEDVCVELQDGFSEITATDPDINWDEYDLTELSLEPLEDDKKLAPGEQVYDHGKKATKDPFKANFNR